MPTDIGRERVRELLEQGAQLIDVLPAEEYETLHLPGAVSIPLKTLGPAALRGLRREAPTIVYCFDGLCDLSPRAAWRLEALGFEDVYDYTAGEVDWAAYGLPVEGHAANRKVIGRLAISDVPTCTPNERLGEVAARVHDAGWDTCVVVNPQSIVLGRLFATDLKGAPDLPAGDAMRPGSSTYRPDVPVEELLPKLQARGWHTALVTSPDGRLVGLVREADLLG